MDRLGETKMRLIHLGLWISAVAAAVPATAQHELMAQKDSVLDRALDAITSGQPAKAIEIVEPAIAAYEKTYSTEKRRIYCDVAPAQTIAALAQAAADKTDAVALDSTYCSLLYAKAFALVDIGNLAEGETAFSRLVELAPFNSRYVFELANTRRTTHRFDLALQGYEKAAALANLAPAGRENPERAAAWRQIGWIYVEQGKWDEAEAMYRKCLTLDPKDEKSKAELGYIAEHRPKKS
jgi:tetratricopeptide (TPR) repeat protein